MADDNQAVRIGAYKELRLEVGAALGLPDHDPRIDEIMREVMMKEFEAHVARQAPPKLLPKPAGKIEPDLYAGLTLAQRVEADRKRAINEMIDGMLKNAGITRQEAENGYTHVRKFEIGSRSVSITHAWSAVQKVSTTTTTMTRPDGSSETGLREVDFKHNDFSWGTTHTASDGKVTRTGEESRSFAKSGERAELVKLYGVFHVSGHAETGDGTDFIWTGPDNMTHLSMWSEANADGSATEYLVVWDDLGILYRSETRVGPDGQRTTKVTTPGGTISEDSTNTSEADTDDDPTDDDPADEGADSDNKTDTAMTNPDDISMTIDLALADRPTRLQMLGHPIDGGGEFVIALDDKGRPVLRQLPGGGVEDPNPEADVVLVRGPLRPRGAGPEFGPRGPVEFEEGDMRPPSIDPYA